MWSNNAYGSHLLGASMEAKRTAEQLYASLHSPLGNRPVTPAAVSQITRSKKSSSDNQQSEQQTQQKPQQEQNQLRQKQDTLNDISTAERRRKVGRSFIREWSKKKSRMCGSFPFCGLGTYSSIGGFISTVFESVRQSTDNEPSTAPTSYEDLPQQAVLIESSSSAQGEMSSAAGNPERSFDGSSTTLGHFNGSTTPAIGSNIHSTMTPGLCSNINSNMMPTHSLNINSNMMPTQSSNINSNMMPTHSSNMNSNMTPGLNSNMMPTHSSNINPNMMPSHNLNMTPVPSSNITSNMTPAMAANLMTSPGSTAFPGSTYIQNWSWVNQQQQALLNMSNMSCYSGSSSIGRPEETRTPPNYWQF